MAGTRLPASGQISFYQIAVYGGNNGVTDVSMHDLRYNYPTVDDSNPDELSEFYSACACESYEIGNNSDTETLYITYQGCDGYWQYSVPLGAGSSTTIDAIYGTVSALGAPNYVYDIGEACP